MNNIFFSQINIIYKHTYSIITTLKRKLIVNEQASLMGRLRNTGTDH